MPNIEFIQVNLKKAFVAAIELGSRLGTKEDYVCLVTEPYKYKSKLSNVPQSAKIIAQVDNRTRAAIFYKGPKEILKIEALCEPDLSLIHI